MDKNTKKDKERYRMNKREYKYRFFLKFGKKEHIEAFQKKGQIYMNTLGYFRTLPEENLIGDRLEGIQFLKQLRNINVTLDINGNRTSILQDGVGQMYPTNMVNGNIYCIYGGDEIILEKYYKKDHGELPLGPIFGSTEYIAAITDPKQFLQRILGYLELTSLKYKYQPIEYLDYKLYEGKLNQFHKRIKYKGQNEFRIYVENLVNQPLIFEIGDLTDICHIAKTKDHLNLKYRAIEDRQW